jgi:tRNA pseudouridine32 synthase/23S rRNA pseudouridine746 synthase
MTPIHLDAQLIVVDKPAGLLAVPGRHETDCMAARVQALWPDARVVHRLDMATSGLLLFARGDRAQRVLGQAFAARRVDKRYLAVVHGLPAADQGSVELPLAADWPNRPRQVVDAVKGKPALTHWRVLARDTATGTTRLELQPVTGRSHQLRVHLAAIGHAIVGDALYGRRDGSARLLLHACALAFAHPASGEPLRFESLPPF